VIDLVAEVGYEQTTIEAVARRAGASKATIYRRWAGKRALVVAAVTAHQGGELAPIDSGTLRGDLLILARRLAATLASSHGSLILALLQEAASDPELCELIEQGAGQTGARLPDAMLQRAIGRGELPETATSYAYDEVVGSVLIVRALTGYPLDDEYLAHLMDAIVLPALRTSAAPAPGPALFAGQPAPGHRRSRP
jgi:AcrR family transcriptional regulator